jgi:hypothetical protein
MSRKPKRNIVRVRCATLCRCFVAFGASVCSLTRLKARWNSSSRALLCATCALCFREGRDRLHLLTQQSAVCPPFCILMRSYRTQCEVVGSSYHGRSRTQQRTLWIHMYDIRHKTETQPPAREFADSTKRHVAAREVLGSHESIFLQPIFLQENGY